MSNLKSGKQLRMIVLLDIVTKLIHLVRELYFRDRDFFERFRAPTMAVSTY